MLPGYRYVNAFADSGVALAGRCHEILRFRRLSLRQFVNLRITCIIQKATDMRYEPEHKTQTRDRIVRNAARKLRAEGLSGPGVASVMKASGLTVGGFYKHFRSKDELLAEAIAQGFSEFSEKVYSSLQKVPREDRWKEIVRWYLSPEHCNHPDTGCPVVALAPEIARAKLEYQKTNCRPDERAYGWVGGVHAGSDRRQSGSETSWSFLARWRVPWRLPVFLPSLPTGRECWPVSEIIFWPAFEIFLRRWDYDHNPHTAYEIREDAR